MALTKEQKKKIIKDLKEKIGRQKIMIFVDFKSVETKNLFDLRRKLKKENSQFSIAKKTLMRLALKNYNEFLAKEIEKLEGQVAIVFGFKNEILPAKTCYQFSQKNENLKILGGFFENKFKEAEEMITLAKLPTKEELLANLVGSMKAPIANFINVLQGNIKGLIYALSAIKK